MGRPLRSRAASVFLAVAGLVMLAGCAGTRILETRAATCRAGTSPGARLGHALGYMDDPGVLVLFGGFHADGLPLADTWSWDGCEWQRLTAPGPTPRRWPAMAYDSRRRRLILHGGRDGIGSQGRPLDDTWEWNGTRWRLLAAAGPGARDHHRLAYDAARDRIVLFGGWDGQATRSDTWEMDGDGWRRSATSGPSARAAHGMSYDERRGRVVLFGGSSDTLFYADTWAWDGGGWSEIQAPGPSARSFHGMTYDPDSETIVVAGGRRGTELLADTWTFDGSRWASTGDTTLPARYVYDMTYDRARAEIVFHGGGYMRDGRWTVFDETWTHRGSWARVR